MSYLPPRVKADQSLRRARGASYSLAAAGRHHLGSHPQADRSAGTPIQNLIRFGIP